MPPVLVTVSPSSALPMPLTLIWPELPSVPFFSTPVPVRSISPLSVTVPAAMLAWFSVSVPVLSTVMVPPVLSIVVGSMSSAPPARTSILPVLVTVSPSSALPVPLTLI